MNKITEFTFSQNKDDLINFLKQEYEEAYIAWYKSTPSQQCETYNRMLKCRSELAYVDKDECESCHNNLFMRMFL